MSEKVASENNLENSKSLRASFYLDDWLIDPQSDQISQGEKLHKLESKVMALLVFLANHPQKVISRETIENAVWGESVVGYDALTTSIGKLRKALGDNSRSPKYIATVAKKGYQLIAPVTKLESVSYAAQNEETSSSITKLSISAKKRPDLFKSFGIVASIMLLLTLTTGLVMGTKSDKPENMILERTVGTPSIAVLPFSSYSKNTDYSLSDGVTEDITSAIAQLSGIRVVANASIMHFKDPKDSINFMAKSLGVRYLLKGSVRQNNDQVFVKTQLVDGETGYLLWAQQYSGNLQALLDLQNDIVHKIAKHLVVHISEEETRRIAKRYTTDINAYEAFLRGQHYLSHHTQTSNEEARVSYLQAITLDPSFARAYAGLALTYLDEYRYLWVDEPSIQATKERAISLATKALNVDSNLAQAHWVLAKVHLSNKSFEQALISAQKAIAIEPNYADAIAILAVSNIYTGNAEKGVSLMEKALRLNPEAPARYLSAIGQAYYYSNAFEDAEIALKSAIKRNSTLTVARVFLIATLHKLANTEEASWEIEQLMLTHPSLTIESLNALLPIDEPQMLLALTEPLKNAGLMVN